MLIVTIQALVLLAPIAAAQTHDPLDNGKQETVEGTFMLQPIIKPLDDRSNPEFFSYSVGGLLLKAANDCLATGALVSLHTFVDEGTLYIIPTRSYTTNQRLMCPSLNRPIYQFAESIVRFSRKEVQQITIRNVESSESEYIFTP
jgi:hypothetical protein